MRKALVAAVALSMLAAVAGASELRVFLSTGNALNASSIPGGLTPTNPQISPGTDTVVYLWGQRVTSNTWTGLSLSTVGAGGATVTGLQLYNPNMGTLPDPNAGEIWSDTEKYRWQNGAISAGDPNFPDGAPPNLTINADASGTVIASAVSGSWLIFLGAATPGTDKQGFTGTVATTGNTNRYYLLGQMHVTGPLGGSVKLAVGSGWITTSGGLPSTDTVDFGFGDPAIRSQGVINNVSATGFVSDLADLTITPEPASLVLLALAGLALRRR